MRQKIGIITIISMILLLVLINMPSLALYTSPTEDDPIKELQKSDILSAWKDDVRLTNNSADSCRPDIAVDSQGNIHTIWQDYRGGGMGVYYKRYNNVNWSMCLQLDDSISGGGGGFPTVGVDRADNIHVAWAGGPTTYEIYYTKYNGTDWSAPIPLTTNSGYSVAWMPQIGPRIVTDSKGWVYIFWTDCSDTYPDGRDIAYVYYNGTNWSGKQRATDDHRDEYDHFNPVVAVDSNDNIHLVYVTTRPSGVGGYGIYEIHYRKFDGNNWSEEVNVSNSPYGAKNLPSIAVDSQDNIYVVWSDTRDDPAVTKGEIYHSKLDNEGNILVSNLRLTDFTIAVSQPALATDKEDNLHIMFIEYSDAKDDKLYYMKLNNEGGFLIDITYLSNTAVKDAVVFSIPRIAIDSLNRLHVVFMDDRDGNLEIYYKGTYAQDLSISSEDISFSNLYPQPNETVYINATVHNTGEILTNATMKFYYGFVSDESLIDTCNVSVPVNDIKNASVSWNAIAGNHTIFVVINCTNVIAEANVTNNTASKILLVKSQHPPNVVIDSPKNLETYLDTDNIYFDASNSSDTDNDTLSFYWVSNISGYIGNTSQFYAALPAGYHLITLWVDDNSGHNVSATVNISVKENQYPSIDYYYPELNNIVINETETQVFYINASDPEGLNLTYTWYINNSTIIDATTNVYTFASNYTSTGIYNITVIVSDGALCVSRNWNLTVHNKNREPVLQFIENQTVYEGQLFELQINATDLDNDTLTFSDNSTLFNISSITGLISFTPNYDSAGVYLINITVTDGEDIVWQVFKLEIININRAPTAMISSPTNNSEFTANDNISFDATGSYDLDNNTLTFLWFSNISGDIGNKSKFNLTLTKGTHLITLIVNDTYTEVSTQVTIVVNEPSWVVGGISEGEPWYESPYLIPGIGIIILIGVIVILLSKRRF